MPRAKLTESDVMLVTLLFILGSQALELLKSRFDEAACDRTHEPCPNSPFSKKHHGLEQFTCGTQTPLTCRCMESINANCRYFASR